MSLIEGIGDEVIQFFGIILVLLFGLIAWWSTALTELPPIRTVLIFERRAQSDLGNQRPTLITSQPERIDPPPNRNSGAESQQFQENNETEKNSIPVSAENVTSSSVAGVASDVPLVETNSQVPDCCQDDIADPDGRRSEGAICNEKSDSRNPTNDGAEETVASTNEPGRQDMDNIRIRLKYLNDDQKLVRGKLNELLGDFKRRHFSMELSREKRVRLIFNGQVLQSDEQTLQGCGLYDNCVVHCLVHTQLNMNRPSSQTATQANPSPQEWNLGGLLYFSISVFLVFAWFIRYHYAQVFSLSTTTSLIGLTAVFAISIIATYLPDLPTQVERPP